MCSHRELTKDHVLTSAYVEIFRTVTRNAVDKSVWRKKDCSWLPFNKHAMNIWLSSLRIRAHLSWRTGKHLHVLLVLRTYSTWTYPGYQDTTTYAALQAYMFYPDEYHCRNTWTIMMNILIQGDFPICPTPSHVQYPNLKMPWSQPELLFHEIPHLREHLVGSLTFFHFGTEHVNKGAS